MLQLLAVVHKGVAQRRLQDLQRVVEPMLAERLEVAELHAADVTCEQLVSR